MNKKSLKVIEQTIANATLREDGFHYLLWGWLVLGSSLLHFALLNFTNFGYPAIPWPIVMPLGGIMAFFYEKQRVSQARVSTYFDVVMKYLWSGFVINLLILLAFGLMTTPILIQPSVMVLIGLAIFVSGGCLRFKPLIVGVLINWLLAILGFIFPEWSLLLLGLAVLIGYIIPGYMLRSHYKQQNRSGN